MPVGGGNNKKTISTRDARSPEIILCMADQSLIINKLSSLIQNLVLAGGVSTRINPQMLRKPVWTTFCLRSTSYFSSVLKLKTRWNLRRQEWKFSIEPHRAEAEISHWHSGGIDIPPPRLKQHPANSNRNCGAYYRHNRRRISCCDSMVSLQLVFLHLRNVFIKSGTQKFASIKQKSPKSYLTGHLHCPVK